MKSVLLILLIIISFFIQSCNTSVDEEVDGYDEVSYDESQSTTQNEEKFHQRHEGENDFYEVTMPWVETFIDAVLNDDIEAISKRIDYPLRRQSPIPAITSEKEFLEYPFNIFDEEIKQQLRDFLETPDLMDFTSSNGTIGILNGLIWFWEDGTVASINYTSSEELEHQNALSEELVDQLHSSIKNYNENYYLGKTSKFIVRIDDTEDGMRYASWSIKNKMSDKPDLIILDGELEKQGTAGGYTYTFINNNYTYILDQVFTGENETQLGDFLIVKKGDKEISNEKCTEVHDEFSLF